MSLITKKEISVNVHSSHNHQRWIIETQFPDWQETLPYWTEATDICNIDETASNVSMQSYFKQTEGIALATCLRDYVNLLLTDIKAPIRAGATKVAWTLEYKTNGWQAAHNHSDPYTVISCVLCLEGKKDSGTFFALLPESDGTQQIITIDQVPGTLIIVEGDVWHGAYPCTTGKKVYVFDFWQEILSNDINT